MDADAGEHGVGQTAKNEDDQTTGTPERPGRVLRQQGTNPEAPPRKKAKTNPQADGIDDAEEGARAAVTDDEQVMAYIGQIQRDIAKNWSRPPSARNGMQAILRVFLVPTGELVDVQIAESSGNTAFDRSAMVAVEKVSRFSVPDQPALFEKSFREFTLLFRPEDLRL